ncbi:MAG: DUF1294 domain-containing protein [Pseudomonadota bacterium]|nr:DUF1294 domain-containing protein [Pseudomonadota bacterium]
MRTQGKITSWNASKGFGFVKPSNGEKDLFIHIKEFNWKPEIGQLISYVASTDPHGRPCAKRAILVGEFLKHEKSSLSGFMSIVLAVLFLFSLGAFFLLQKLSLWVLIIYSSLSLFTFIIYWADKSASKNGNWRTPENTLHFLALIGGWPGALIAQQKLKHKTKKEPFLLILWITILVNLSTLAWLLDYATIPRFS